MSMDRTLRNRASVDVRKDDADLPDWRQQLPTLIGHRVVLREMRPSDAPELFTVLTTAEVVRFISPPPPNVMGFEHFIARARAQQAVGKFACFTLTLKGHDSAIGMFQIRELDPGFFTGEWGFAIASPFWGTGLFLEGAELMLDFAFNTIGVHRLEARAAAKNGRGNRALQKLGAVPEGVLRHAFLCNGEYVDQVLYGLVEDEWRQARQQRLALAPALVH